MKDLLPHYEAELALLRRLCRGFAERYPGIAGGLMLAGETCKDPHVERMIQASALLAARISSGSTTITRCSPNRCWRCCIRIICAAFLLAPLCSWTSAPLPRSCPRSSP